MITHTRTRTQTKGQKERKGERTSLTTATTATEDKGQDKVRYKNEGGTQRTSQHNSGILTVRSLSSRPSVENTKHDFINRTNILFYSK